MINLVEAEGFGQSMVCWQRAFVTLWPLHHVPYPSVAASEAAVEAALSFSITSKTMSYLPGNHATSTQKSLDAFTFGLGGLTRTTASQGLHSSQGQLQAKSLWHQATSCTASGQFACRSHRRVSLFL